MRKTKNGILATPAGSCITFCGPPARGNGARGYCINKSVRARDSASTTQTQELV